MDVLDAIYSRRSIRSYTGEALTNEQEDILLKAANASPIGLGQYESVHITVVKNEALLREIERAYGELTGRPRIHPLYGAPELFVVSVKTGGPANIAYANAGVVVHNMSLAATALGIGHVYISGVLRAIDMYPEVRKKMGIPNGFVPGAALAVGATDEIYKQRDVSLGKIATNFIG